ncbi:hypothetical protein GCM10020358_16820 [Amorphoplanes nipponensis]|uniref:hypothetical protein n=1 Tax=Actinoplanes nipponensis TaxID=135950 RepID=UPI0031EC7D2B
MKAVQWQGVDKLAVNDVPDPELRDPGDVIVKVTRTVTCGSDLHLLGGYIQPTRRSPRRCGGQAPGGCFGYSHAMGGNLGSHAEYIRVPFADVGAFRVPDEVGDERAVFAADAAATGWIGADLGGVGPGRRRGRGGRRRRRSAGRPGRRAAGGWPGASW